MNVAMEFLQSWLGGGAIVGILSAYLLYRSNDKGRDIDWYDRAILQVKELDAKIIELEKNIKKLNGTIQSEREEKQKLQALVRDMEYIIKELRVQMEDRLESKKKGVFDDEET